MDYDLDEISQLRIGTDWTEMEIVNGPDVVLNFRGYTPVVLVKAQHQKRVKMLYISASSISKKLEELRIKNNGSFIGLKFRLCKESEDKMAKYILESLK
tara:strand:+ start:7353 stop:7649 length:297 start_codon:yes stop_codon:yes gene_type:complete